jgi:hypothetical protein
MLTALLALLPVLGPAAAGMIGRWLGGARGEEVAGTVMGAIGSIAGGTEAAQVRQAMADPERAGALLVQIQQIAADAEAAERAHVEEMFKAAIAETANARAQTIALAQANSRMAWMPAILSGAITALFTFSIVGSAFGLVLSPAGERLVEWAMIGVLGYWLGTSRGAVEMRRGIQAQAGASPLERGA